jgi:hypothetical protein
MNNPGDSVDRLVGMRICHRETFRGVVTSCGAAVADVSKEMGLVNRRSVLEHRGKRSRYLDADDVFGGSPREEATRTRIRALSRCRASVHKRRL